MRTTTILLLASFLLACGGSDGTVPIPAVVDDNESANEPAEAEAQPPTSCNTITNDAEPLSSIAVVASDAPTPKGGTIPSGTFHLASIRLYAGKSGTASSIPITLKSTVEVSGTTVLQVLDGTRPDGSTLAERSSESFVTNGSEITFTKTCDGTGSRTGTFTATSSALTLFLVNDVGQTVGYEYR